MIEIRRIPDGLSGRPASFTVGGGLNASIVSDDQRTIFNLDRPHPNQPAAGAKPATDDSDDSDCPCHDENLELVGVGQDCEWGDL
jgi:hypothetical protein